MRRDLQSAGLGGDQGVFVGLGCGQGAGRTQPDQAIVIEHAFNISGDGDTHRRHPERRTNGQHLTNSDNT
jgi:hypothetical protein